jgi:hypothetical protein
MSHHRNLRNWIARLLIFLIVADNFQAAILFLFHPDGVASSFELTGLISNSIIQGMGLLFLMWCVPYVVALINPAGNRVSLYESIAMQAIAVVGETTLLILLPVKLPSLEATVLKFVVFDLGGLVLLLLAACLTRKESDVPS